MTILLGSMAAASCPVKTQNVFSPLEELPDHPPDGTADPSAAARASRPGGPTGGGCSICG